MINNNTIAITLRRARMDANFTQQEVADALSISLWTYNRVERGRQRFKTEWVEVLPQGMRMPVVNLLAAEQQRELDFLRRAARIARPKRTESIFQSAA